jgi:chromosome segregation protein
VNRATDEGAGVLAREQEMKTVAGELRALEAEVQASEETLRTSQDELKGLEAEQGELQARLSDAHRRQGGLQSQVSGRQARYEQLKARAERLAAELAELRGQETHDRERLARAREDLQHSIEQMQLFAERRESLAQDRERLQAVLDAARQERGAARDRIHRDALRIEGMRTRRDSLERGLARTEDQVQDLQGRREEMLMALAESEAPLAEARAHLGSKLALRIQVEAELKGARQEVEEVDARLRELDRRRHEAEQTVQQRQGALEQARVNHQATTVRLQTVEDQLAEFGYGLGQLLESLADRAAEAEWQEKVEETERRIARLGPINLAAIEEYAQQSERKAYLDAQYNDLMEALTTLHNAIRKIDRETRTRFKETFERVNAGLKDAFPRLFGGGHAYLELTSDDLLETGVTVMARPPGKRNSTIHLLSGGEKALTAVAVVFAIFELNPAPFCLLDEVDAPLDDNNVGRFCALVKSMSDRVQFMFITHNKTTMELSDHLVGVTMHEPGVSRLVAVDVDAAMAMAAV